ncbi:primosomal protein N' [Alysiella filiformis]|uniref:Replication restart protein PriA n=1 Tax=Alysiella filiformis DSM 16848 TaxID=1120981 RepID=A0A286EEL9_9NEIS|nr:primosomal protein N' [Alysiella filiformis]QMT31635.1 primosomal protein N' [Alysiella filiformis]UBQ55354.1 primosomal protein N' [Alysiella filiformis DSM 16848]SOD69309.1 replication restart DNA helicase PriA [Alysiella filiformis DSM 16848]
MIYHHIVLNTILPPLTYSYHHALPLGCRVVVKLRGKAQIGIVWASGILPDIAPEKILPIQQVFENEVRLPETWRDLIAFAARYYHYPIGQTAFTALPSLLKEIKAVDLPTPPVFYALNDVGKQQNPPAKHHAKKFALWQSLLSGSHTLAELKKIHPKAADFIHEYQQNGWLDANTHALPSIPPSQHILNDEQQAASQAVQAHLFEYQAFLLHGITGGGKTEVYFDIMASVLAQGKQVLFLLPEINLTPQLLQRIAARFPDMPTAVLHSQTASSQRGRDYLRAMLGQAKLIIGTRLSVFTPIADLGLIVVDEEHDSSFKQDNDLRYHARDLAVWRARQAGCPIVLGSATPSLETWHKAHAGIFTLLTLSHRANVAARLPEIQILDVRRLRLDNGLSPQVLQLLQNNVQQGGLSLVYLNRRGFAPALFCGDCGHTFGCPHCSAKMVLHQRAGQLRCHHCDFRQPIPQSCAECGNQDLTAIGQGTQRIETTLQQYLPHAQIARVDRDSTSHKNDWAELYARIEHRQIDILIGTQMLAKGHDFANLNLVVVLNADGSLFSSDFRAPERLFAELMQVSGRAGRAEKAGKVVIQTQLPEHAVFQAIRQQDFAQFATPELAQRQQFALPPFGFQAAVRADAAKMQDAVDFLNEIRDVIAPLMPESVFQLGAIPMLMARLAERERAQIFIESTDRVALHRALSLWQQSLFAHAQAHIRWHIDVDCQEM